MHALVAAAALALLVPAQNEGSVIKVVSVTSRDAPTPKVTKSTRPAPKLNPVQPISIRPLARPRPTPVPLVQHLAVTATADLENDKPTKILPWVTLGGSIVVGALGGFFAVKTGDVLSLPAPTMTGQLGPDGSVSISDELQDRQKAVFQNGLAATLLLSTAAAGTVSSLIALLSE